MTTDEPFPMSPRDVSRVEVIGPGGREFVGYYEPGVALCLQDDDRTLKIFVGDTSKAAVEPPTPPVVLCALCFAAGRFVAATGYACGNSLCDDHLEGYEAKWDMIADRTGDA